MCGICGYLDPGMGSTDAATLSAMLKTIINRGPDDEGRFDAPGIAIGMRRLAIIDIQGGKQPRSDADTGVVLIFNGEIYNYRELRSLLEKRGQRCLGESDSEVLLRAYLEFGESFVHHLNGMFAIAIWDPRDQALLLARDHLGQKPLYYWASGEHFVFGSDLRAILQHPRVPRRINSTALFEYLRLRHVPGPATIVKGIEQLPAGSMLKVMRGGHRRESRYWQPEFVVDDRLDLDSAVEQYTAIWQRVIRRHLLSDVPLGAFLSGGIDSSLVVAEAAESVAGFKTFSIAFGDKGFDETPFALEAADTLGCVHEVFPFNESLESLLQEWAVAYDQPFADPAMFPSLILARQTRPKVTVVLTGDGGDELFAGYQRYRSTLMGQRLSQVPAPLRRLASGVIGTLGRGFPAGWPARRWLDAVSRRISLIGKDVAREYKRQFHIYNEAQLANLVNFLPDDNEAGWEGGSLLEKMLHYDLEHWLPDQMLVKMDRATMAYSLEARLPFLDRELVDFALSLPSAVQMQGRQTKSVLRKAAARRLPRGLARRPKHGFAVPVDRWLREDSEMVEAVLEEGTRRHADLINSDAVALLWNEHREQRANHGERLLALLIFFVWSSSHMAHGRHCG